MIDHDCFADHLESITVGVELNFAAIFDQAQNLSIDLSICDTKCTRFSCICRNVAGSDKKWKEGIQTKNKDSSLA